MSENTTLMFFPLSNKVNKEKKIETTVTLQTLK